MPQKLSHFFNIFGPPPETKISPSPSSPEWQRCSSSWRQLITWWPRRSREKKPRQPTNVGDGWWVGCRVRWSGGEVWPFFLLVVFIWPLDKIRKKLQRLPSQLIFFSDGQLWWFILPLIFRCPSLKSRKTLNEFLYHLFSEHPTLRPANPISWSKMMENLVDPTQKFPAFGLLGVQNLRNCAGERKIIYLKFSKQTFWGDFSWLTRCDTRVFNNEVTRFWDGIPFEAFNIFFAREQTPT